MSDKLSVIISVGKGPGLQPPLPGSYTGHAEYKAWAVTQGHDIVEFTDENGDSFNAVDISNEIRTPIGNQSLAELWIYFAGHGECSAIQSDYWLLKREGAGPGDVIDVAKTRRLATLMGVPRVVIIADSCRTTGDLQSLAAQENAVSILPALNITAFTPSVECLFATQPGSPSLEIREKHAKAHGVFTTVLLRALRGEVPSVQTRSDDGAKLVVRLRDLRLYLEEQVPTEAGARANGQAQRPNIIEGGSTEPYATVGDVPNLEVRIDTVTEDGSPASNTRIQLSMITGQTDVRHMGDAAGPTASFLLPSGSVYEASASGPYTNLRAESPLPIFRLTEPKNGRFVAIENPHNYRFEASGGLTSSGSALPSIAVTRVVSEDGGLHAEAPTPGVFTVVTYDALTGNMASELQRFAADNLTPKPISTPVNDSIKNQILASAKVHGRRSFETKTGITLIGLPLDEEPQVAAPRGAFDSTFLDAGSWQIRGNHSAGLLIKLRDHFLTGAVFNELIGAIRLRVSLSHGPTIEDLSYAPASSSRYGGDLDRFDYPDKRLSDSPRDEVDALQLIAAQCARNEFFEVTIDESVGLAQRMRELKHYNPVFGVLAAYAYDKVGRQDQIIDMVKWFIRMEQSIPFDLVMLADLTQDELETLIDETDKTWNGQIAATLGAWVVPTWPMLTQGWSQISMAHLDRFPILKDARNSLVPGFWTVLSGDVGERCFKAVNEGQMQWI